MTTFASSNPGTTNVFPGIDRGPLYHIPVGPKHRPESRQRQHEGAWPKPPKFDRNTPLTSSRLKPTEIQKRMSGEKIDPDALPAPFSGVEDSEHTLLQKNWGKKTQQLSLENPFGLDTETDPFTPLAPSFFKKKKKPKIGLSIPRPCFVQAAEPVWEEMDLEEQKAYYYDKKEEFVEYLSETRTVRLELLSEAACDQTYEAYQRCLGIKNMKWGGMRWSTARGALMQMFTCSPQFHDYHGCLSTVDNDQLNARLDQDEHYLLQTHFPR